MLPHDQIPEGIPQVVLKLRELRLSLGITQRELAAELGLKPANFMKYEVGSEGIPRRIPSGVLDCMHALLERWTERPPPKKKKLTGLRNDPEKRRAAARRQPRLPGGRFGRKDDVAS